jgi:hypothetical protein
MGRAGKARRRGGLIARKEKQRGQRVPARLTRVRSVVTLVVTVVVSEKINVHAVLPAVGSGQLLFLG